MTELQKLYAAAREGDAIDTTTSMGAALGGAGARRSRGHHAALRHVARQTGIDKDSVERSLQRARRADVLEARSRRAAA